jgi:hypothetical protein
VSRGGGVQNKIRLKFGNLGLAMGCVLGTSEAVSLSLITPKFLPESK